jgi:tight adherence protein B
VESGRGVAGFGAASLGGAGPGGAGATVTSQEQSDLATLEVAWRLAEQAGAATSVVTAAAASSIRARHAAAERASVVAAGPRASMWLLSALPVAGPLAAVVVGITPGRLYGTDAARASALAGLLLAAVGWWWARALVRRSQRPGRTDGSVA